MRVRDRVEQLFAIDVESLEAKHENLWGSFYGVSLFSDLLLLALLTEVLVFSAKSLRFEKDFQTVREISNSLLA